MSFEVPPEQEHISCGVYPPKGKWHTAEALIQRNKKKGGKKGKKGGGEKGKGGGGANGGGEAEGGGEGGPGGGGGGGGGEAPKKPAPETPYEKEVKLRLKKAKKRALHEELEELERQKNQAEYKEYLVQEELKKKTAAALVSRFGPKFDDKEILETLKKDLKKAEETSNMLNKFFSSRSKFVLDLKKKETKPLPAPKKEEPPQQCTIM